MPRQPGQGDQAVEVKRLSDEGAPPALRHPRRGCARTAEECGRSAARGIEARLELYGLAGVTREVAEIR
jgi:hypothetical protein